MLSPQAPVVIEKDNPVGLDYWVWRCSEGSGRPSPFYLRYRDVQVILYPHRAAVVVHDGRQITVDTDKRYKGKNWKNHLCEDIEAAITSILDGGGEPPELYLGDWIRAEQVRRKEAGTVHAARAALEREHWCEWLKSDELTVLMGAWLVVEGLVASQYNLSRHSAVGVTFHPTNDEFDATTLASRPTVMYEILRRLAAARFEQDPNPNLVATDDGEEG